MLKLSCIILAGGKSRRMGRDKRELKIGGNSFFEIAIENAQTVSEDVIVSVRDRSQVTSVPNGIRIVVDEDKDRGPLFALATSLKTCKKERVALLPVDAPLLRPDIYNRMLEEMEKEGSIEAVIPRTDDGPQHLYGIYVVTALLSACRKAILQKENSVMNGISHLGKVKYIEAGFFNDIDPKLLSFQNINTPLDLERLMEKTNEKRP